MTRVLEPISRSSTGADSLTDYLFASFAVDGPAALFHRFPLRGAEVVVLSRGDELALRWSAQGDRRTLNIFLPDPFLSAPHARLVRSDKAWTLIDRGSTNGTHHRGSLITRAALADGEFFEAGATLFLHRSRLENDAALAISSADIEPGARPVTLLPGLARKLAALRAIATQPTISVLLLGETGTGKEGAARAVHAWSLRSGPFVAVNCRALPESLVESELFGSVRGAFTGAAQSRQGLIRAAQRGTLFLDEVGDLPLGAQGALLRVLQEGEVRPVGGDRTFSVDVRVVSATNRDLDAMVQRGLFRADLYWRLAGHLMALPPLRERREDLGILTSALLGRHGVARASFSRDAARALFLHAWPGNIRELEKCLQVAVTLAPDGIIRTRHLPPALQRHAESWPVHGGGGPPPPETDERRREQLLGLLQRYSGNLAAVGRAMACSRTQVQRWLKRYGIDASAYRPGRLC